MRRHQEGTDAIALASVVERARYKQGWSVTLRDIERETEHLAGSSGTTLCVGATVRDSTSPPNALHTHSATTKVEHWFEVPTACWDGPTWERWVFDCILQVEQHEAMEFFQVGDEKPFFPAHGPGRNPYTIERKCA